MNRRASTGKERRWAGGQREVSTGPTGQLRTLEHKRGVCWSLRVGGWDPPVCRVLLLRGQQHLPLKARCPVHKDPAALAKGLTVPLLAVRISTHLIQESSNCLVLCHRSRGSATRAPWPSRRSTEAFQLPWLCAFHTRPHPGPQR